MRTLIVIWFAVLAWTRPACVLAAEAPSTAPGEKLAVVLLPAHLFVWKIQIKGEISEEWTATARATVDAALEEVISHSERFSVQELPSLAPEERAAIEEMLGVAVRVQQQIEVKTESKALRAQVDRTLGPSLSFLRDRTGADHAWGLMGYQAEQSKGLAAFNAAGVAASVLFPPLLILPTVSGSYAALFLIDLRTGELRWINEQSGFEVGGINFTDLREPDSARKVIEKLIEPYPAARPLRGEKTQPPVPTEPISPLLGEFELRAPCGWRVKDYDVTDNAVTLTRDGRLLNEIQVELRPHRAAFPESGQPSTRGSPPEQLAQWYVAELQSQELEDVQIVETALAQLAGKPAFRLRYSYRTPPQAGGARAEEVAIGAAVPHGLLLARLSAPQLNYFAKALPAFEETTRTIVLIPRRYLHRNNGR